MAKRVHGDCTLPDPTKRPLISIEEAAPILLLGRSRAYELARTGNFPVPLMRIGNRFRVPSAPLLAALGLEPEALVPDVGSAVTSAQTLTAKELADCLGTSPWSIYQAVNRGDCPVPPIRVGRRIVFARALVDQLLGVGSD